MPAGCPGGSAVQESGDRQDAGGRRGRKHRMGRKEKNIVGLDIGSTKVCTLIAATRDGTSQRDESKSGLEPIGLGLADSKGVRKGAVVNLEAIVESIKKSVGEAEAMAGCEVETVYVGLAGPHIKSFNTSGVLPIPSRHAELNG